MALRPFPSRGLYVILERTLVPPGRGERLLAVCLAEGVAAVQYRDKRPPEDYDLRELARLASLCREARVPFLVDDHPAVAARVGADGVHLGRDDPPPARARRLLPPGTYVGISCYDEPERALRAAREGADYVAFGAFYPSRTKPGARSASPDVLVRARRLVDLPLVAIGGIDETNAAPLLAAGAGLLAVARALFEDPAEDAVRARARRLVALAGRPAPVALPGR